MAPRTRRYSTRLADMQVYSDVDMEQDDEIDVENYDDEQEVEDADVEPEEDEDEDEDEKDEIQSEEEDDEPIPSPRKTQPRIRIKLKLGANKRITSSSDSTARPTPEVETTPSRTRTRKKQRTGLESQDSDSPESDNDDDESSSISRATGQPKPMTTRQAVLASVVDSSHVSLGESSRSKKKVLNESELALRREETARKRKNLTEKKLEDEKVETINRLLKKQSRPRNKRGTALDDRSPMPSTGPRKGKQKAKEDDGEEGEEVYEEETIPTVEEEVKPTMYRWVSSRTGDGQETKMVLSFSIPPNALATVPSVPGVRSPGSSRCAVSGCDNTRKYRLVKDWTIGACGMAHLKLLEG